MAALLVASMLLYGCGEKKAAPTRVIAPPPRPVNAFTTPPVSSPTPAPQAAPAAVPLETLTVPDQVDARLLPILEKYYKDQQRPAMNWNDLLAGKYIPKIPLGADGKPLDWNTTMQRIGRGVGNRNGR